MDRWSIYWTCWFGISAVAFAIPEGWALVTRNYQDTLSDHIWALGDVMPGQSIVNWTALHVLLGGILLVAMAWLAGHLVFGLWR